MQGIIDYLTGPSLDAKVLRDNFVFKLVPMLNADGVVVGNYRCSLAGLDLNRMWREPSRRLTPPIYALKAMMLRLQEDREVVDELSRFRRPRDLSQLLELGEGPRPDRLGLDADLLAPRDGGLEGVELREERGGRREIVP